MHITDEELELYCLGQTAEPDRVRIDEHILGCGECAELASGVAEYVELMQAAAVEIRLESPQIVRRHQSAPPRHRTLSADRGFLKLFWFGADMFGMPATSGQGKEDDIRMDNSWNGDRGANRSSGIRRPLHRYFW